MYLNFLQQKPSQPDQSLPNVQSEILLERLIPVYHLIFIQLIINLFTLFDLLSAINIQVIFENKRQVGGGLPPHQVYGSSPS